MQTYKARENLWICEIRVHNVLCICEADCREEAINGAIEMAAARASRVSK